MANEPAGAAAGMRSWLAGLSLREAAIVVCGALAAAVAVVVVALPALWYVAGPGAQPGRHQDILADLGELTALDARWEREAWHMLNDFAPDPAAEHHAPLAEVSKRLEAAARHTRNQALQAGLPDVERAFTEKSALKQRFEQSHDASRKALREALAMEPEMADLVREAWRDAPDRQRLVAADNVVTQLLADLQRYYFTPGESTRKNLEASAADLRSAAEIVAGTFKPAAARLDGHVADLLRARPREQSDFDRLRFHPAGARAASLARELRHELDQRQLRQARYRIYLAAYFCALLVLAGYGAARLIRRELALRARDLGAGVGARDEPPPVTPIPPAPPDAAAGP